MKRQHHISGKCYMAVSTHDLWWERVNSGLSDMWPMANCLTLKGSHIRAKDVLGCQDVCLGDGTVGQLIGSHNAYELLGAGSTDVDLELPSCLGLKIVFICVLSFIVSYSINEDC